MVLYPAESKNYAIGVYGKLLAEGIPLTHPIDHDPDPAAVDREIALLRTAKAVVVPVGPLQLTSPATILRKVLRFAREQGKCVFVVHSDRWGAVAPWATSFDVRTDWEKLVGALRTACEAARSPILTPRLPAAYVERPAMQAALRNLLETTAESSKCSSRGFGARGDSGKRRWHNGSAETRRSWTCFRAVFCGSRWGGRRCNRNRRRMRRRCSISSTEHGRR